MKPLLHFLRTLLLSFYFSATGVAAADEFSVLPAVTKSRETIEVGLRERHHVIARPTTLKQGNRYPLIVGFHGHRGEVKAWMHDYTPFEALTSLQNFIIVYPEAPISWSYRSGAGDVEFFDRIVAKVSEDFPVDKARIYALGHSNGAGFASALLYLRPKTVAAVASYAGLAPARSIDPGDPKPPLFVIWGEKDEFAPGASDRVQGSIQSFRNRGYPVEAWIVPNRGHGWGNREDQMEEKILSFFFKHTLPDEK